MIRRVGLLVVVVAALVAYLLWSQRRSEPFHVSGFLEADEIRVGLRVGGRVAEVHVEEGQQVVAEQPLVEIEPFDLVEQRASAAALLAEQQASLALLRAGPRPQEIEAARARAAAADARVVLARSEHERIATLTAGSIASGEALDRATQELQLAEADQKAARENLALLEEGSRAEDIAVARARVQAAEAGLAAIDRRLAELVLRAPTAATVESFDLNPGDLVIENAPVVSLLDRSRLWVRAYLPEDRLDVQIGQPVAVTVDSLAGERFAAHVSFVSRTGEFTPRNIQLPEERTKQVFRIKVMLDAGLDRLRPGMAADVWFDVATGR